MSNAAKTSNVSEINQLIAIGKEKGYLTYEEVNDVLPAHLVAPDQIDDLMHMFGENNIEIVDTPAKGEKSQEDGEKEQTPAEAPVAETKADTVTIDDPVRMYLREMGTISLLTRAGEVEIAKRIEAGQNEVISSVANCSVTTHEITNLGQAVKKGELNVFDIVVIIQANPDVKKEPSEKIEIKRLHKRIRNMVGQEKKVVKLVARSQTKLSEKMQIKVDKDLVVQRGKLEAMMLELSLNADVMDAIIEAAQLSQRRVRGQSGESGPPVS